MLKGLKVKLGLAFDFGNLSNVSTESERAIPTGLGFEEVIKNKALPVRIQTT
jgi:hypothetical protein